MRPFVWITGRIVSRMPPIVPRQEIDRRIGAFQAALEADGLDAALIVESSDLYYLTGTNQDAHLVVPAAGEPVYLVRRDLGRARDESPLDQVEPLTSLRDLGPAILEAAGDITSLGLEFDVLPVANYQRYARMLPGVELRDCMPALRPLRAMKSEWEVGRIRVAAEQIRVAYAAAPRILHAGMTDLELQIEIEHVLRSHGHQGPCRFRGMNGEMYFGAVLAGPDAAVPASSDTPFGGWGLSPAIGRGPRAGLITEGTAVSVDLVGAADGYLADATRTFSVGPLTEPLARALEVCEQILAEVETLLVPGTPWHVPYTRGLEMATEAGFGDGWMGAGAARVSFIGHGIGLEINEPPFLARGLDQPLVAGNVIAVEPKLAFAGVGAVGVENSYLVREHGGPENLTPW
jgi:Xaa-Pro dipeptidase